MFNKIQPRLAMVTHVSYDEELIPEIVAGIRVHYSGLFQFGAPDVVVVNVTKDAVWTRKAAIPEAGNMTRPSPRDAIEPVRPEPDESGGQNSRIPDIGRRRAGAGRPRPGDRPEAVLPARRVSRAAANFPNDFTIDVRQIVQRKLREMQAKLTGEQEKLQQLINKRGANKAGGSRHHGVPGDSERASR